MDLKTFKASTMADALSAGEKRHGLRCGDPAHAHVPNAPLAGFAAAEVVEITAGGGFNVARSRRQAAAAAQRPAPAALAGTYSPHRRRRSPAVVRPRRSSRCARPPRPAGNSSKRPPATGPCCWASTQEMAALKGMVKDLICQTRAKSNPDVPEELFEYFIQLIENQVDPELATDIIRNLQKQIRPEHLQQADFVRERLAEQIEKLLPRRRPDRPHQDRRARTWWR